MEVWATLVDNIWSHRRSFLSSNAERMNEIRLSLRHLCCLFSHKAVLCWETYGTWSQVSSCLFGLQKIDSYIVCELKLQSSLVSFLACSHLVFEICRHFSDKPISSFLGKRLLPPSVSLRTLLVTLFAFVEALHKLLWSLAYGFYILSSSPDWSCSEVASFLLLLLHILWKQVDLEKGLKCCCLSSLLGESSCLRCICLTLLATQDAVGLRAWQTVLPCLLSSVSPLATNIVLRCFALRCG